MLQHRYTIHDSAAGHAADLQTLTLQRCLRKLDLFILFFFFFYFFFFFVVNFKIVTGIMMFKGS